MIVSCCFIFSILISRALLDTVTGFIGGSVILPCFLSKDDLNVQDIDVRWKHNGSFIGHNIIGGRGVTDNLNLLYKDRTETFPAEFAKGNFSLKLKNLKDSDAGKYQCYIIHSSEHVIIQLLINESTAVEEEQPKEEDRNQGETKLLLMKILIPMLCVFVLLCIFFCIAFILRKEGDKTSRSGCLSCRFWERQLSDTSEPVNQDEKDFSGVQI